MSKTAADLHDYLNTLGIEVKTVTHPPLFTVADSQNLRGEIAGGHTKNLFLKDKKDNFFLVAVEEDAIVDLKTIHTLIGAASKVSFGRPEKLLEYLGLIPGAVSVLGAVNDTEHKVSIILDEALMRHEIINAHPLTNEATTSIHRNDLLKFLEATGHEPRIVSVSAVETTLA